MAELRATSICLFYGESQARDDAGMDSLQKESYRWNFALRESYRAID